MRRSIARAGTARLTPRKDIAMVRQWLGESAAQLPLIGVDEAGVASLAGPVVAAAVHLGDSVQLYEAFDLRDSKQISSHESRRIAARLLNCSDVTYCIAVVEAPHVVGVGGSLAARMACVSSCVDELRQKLAGTPHRAPEDAQELLDLRAVRTRESVALIDGAEVPENIKNADCVFGVPRGDAYFACIAAASILSKAVFDSEMERVAAQNPSWGFEKHRGYSTRRHLDEIMTHGPISGVHRDAEACMRIVGAHRTQS
mmetsp:Transcript_10367/g.32115  ORF Transcript_10367/g.32115 Transcript_10367/m.32115 type:complete len:257 (+) Transcript_10367:38-808(+)